MGQGAALLSGTKPRGPGSHVSTRHGAGHRPGEPVCLYRADLKMGPLQGSEADDLGHFHVS